MFNMDGFGPEDLNPVQASVESINVEIPQCDDIGGRRAYDDTIRSADENSGNGPAAAVNGDCLGDGDRTKAARVEDVDFAGCSGLRNRTRKCLAGCGTAAWIGIIADTRDPGSACLSLGDRGKRDRQSRHCKNVQCGSELVHLKSPSFLSNFEMSVAQVHGLLVQPMVLETCFAELIHACPWAAVTSP